MTKDPEMGASPVAERKAGGVMGLHGSSARLTEIVPTGKPQHRAAVADRA